MEFSKENIVKNKSFIFAVVGYPVFILGIFLPSNTGT